VSNVPTDLRVDPSRRGPLGTELMGVSIAIPLNETVDDDTKRPWSQQDWRDFIREAQPQMLDRLRQHVGGARFVAEPQMNVDGPHSDPLQGPIYVLTIAAWFHPASLSADCTAARARQVSRA
jgi:hypothetical protein